MLQGIPSLMVSRGIHHPLKRNLISYWKLDEASGTRIDSHGANDLTDNNTVGSAAGKISDAAQFVAVNSEFLSHIDNTDLSMGDINFTIAFWVYFDSSAGVGASLTLVNKYSVSDNKREFTVIREEIAGVDRIRFYVSSDGTGGTTDLVAWSSAPSNSTWYFVVAWHNATANTINISINDGTPVSAAHNGGAFDSDTPFQLGTLNQLANYYHDGRIDEVGIWKRILTAEEITTLYNGGAGYPYSSF